MPYNLYHGPRRQIRRSVRTTRRKTNTTTARTRRMYKKKGVITTFNPQPNFGPGAKLRTKLNYSVSGTLSSSAGGLSFVQFRMNSLYDPEVALGGGQPMYFNQLEAIYSRYRVWNCRVHMCVHGTSANDSQIVGAPNNNGTALTTADTARLQQAPGAFPIMLSNLYGKPLWNKRSYSLPAHMGMSVSEYGGSDNTAALVGADPVDIIYFAIGLNNPASLTTSITYILKFEYDVEFFDQNVPSVSA